MLTAAGNDLGFEQIFARQVEALCRPRRSADPAQHQRESPNLLAAARAARRRGCRPSPFWAGWGALAGLVDEAIVVPSDETGRIQVIHLALEHLIVEMVERELLGAHDRSRRADRSGHRREPGDRAGGRPAARAGRR